MALFSKLVESQALILLSETVRDSNVFMLSSASNCTATPPYTIKPMIDSFNKLNQALRKVLEEADNVVAEVSCLVIVVCMYHNA